MIRILRRSSAAAGDSATAFFHSLEELTAKTRESGFRQGALLSPGRPISASVLETRMADRARRTQLFDLMHVVEQEETLLGAASRFAAVAEK